MGFFDSVIPTGKSGASAQAASPVVVLQDAPASAPKESDFLIIDSSVSVSAVPDVVVPAPAAAVSAPSDIISFTDSTEITFSPNPSQQAQSEVPAPSESGLNFSALSVLTSEPSALAVISESAPQAQDAVTFAVPADPVVSFEIPSEEPAAQAVQPIEDSHATDSGFFALDAAPASASAMEAASPVEATPTIEAESSAETAPAASFAFHAEPLHETPAPVVEEILDPETIIATSIQQLESVVFAKERARDAETELVEELNAKIADLKQQAKDAQDRARAIDESAERARSLISNLKTQIQAA